MQCTSRMGPDDAERLEERYERAEARIAEARDRHDRQRAVGRLYEMSWKNPYAAYRAGEISELGLHGRAPDHLEAVNMYYRAHRLGDTRATWRLILEHPCSASPEEADARSRRFFMEAALPVRNRRADGTWLCEADDGFIAEAEARADTSPMIRELLTEALRRSRDPKCAHWARRSMGDDCTASAAILAESLMDDAYGSEEFDDGMELYREAVAIAEGPASGEWRAQLLLGREAFCSMFREADDAEALDRFLRAAELCRDPEERRAEVLPYLEYYAASLDGLNPETRPLSRSGRTSCRGRSVRTPCPPLGWCAVPEWALLMRVTMTGPDGTTVLKDHVNIRGGFGNDVFSIVPAVTDPSLPDRPATFVFRPTGLRLELGEDCMEVRAMYEDLDEAQLRGVFLICADSARDSRGGVGA